MNDVAEAISVLPYTQIARVLRIGQRKACLHIQMGDDKFLNFSVLIQTPIYDLLVTFLVESAQTTPDRLADIQITTNNEQRMMSKKVNINPPTKIVAINAFPTRSPFYQVFNLIQRR